MMNRGEEKVRVHMNVVPRSTSGGGRGFDSHRGQKIFFFARVVPCFPLLGITPSGLFMGLSSTIIYTSELILCSTICYSTWAARVIPNQNSFMTKNDFVKASRGEFSKHSK